MLNRLKKMMKWREIVGVIVIVMVMCEEWRDDVIIDDW